MEYIEKFGKADLHIHSTFSDGSNSIEEILDYTETKTDLNIIAICDHDTVEGAYLAKKIAHEKNLRIKVVIGEEISTKEGHVVALFIEKAIPPGLSLPETLDQIEYQGGLAIAPHPMFHTRVRGKDEAVMDGIGFVNLIKYKEKFTGVEIVNATPWMGRKNLNAHFINSSLVFKSETGGSDAHILDAIGKGYTAFEGKDIKSLKYALEVGQTIAIGVRWKTLSLLKYAFFFIPKGIRIFFFTLLHGFTKKRPQIDL
ncbi:MAG: PHP-associated domain-containing protein [Patescibacteria group bacterium]|jgi:hypothetical protein